MSEPCFRLSGFVPMPMSGPCFATPLFTGPTNTPWLQHFGADDRIDDFLHLESGYVPRLRTIESKIERRVRDEAIFGFRLASAEPVFGTRDELIVPLVEAFARLEERPNTQRAIAKFLRNKELLALVEPQAAPPPSRPARVHEPKIPILSDFSTERRPLLEAAAFAVIACGAQPVTALDEFDGDHTRLDLALRNAANSSGMICLLGSPAGDTLGFELGLYLGTSNTHGRRVYPLILSDEPYTHQKSFSSLASHDIHAHHGDSDEVVRAVRNYLVHRFDMKVLGGAALTHDYRQFLRMIPDLKEQRRLTQGGLSLPDFREMAAVFLEER